MPCPSLEELDLYACEALADDARPAVESHVSDCADCARQVAEIRRRADLAHRIHCAGAASDEPCEETSPSASGPAAAPPVGAFAGYTIVRELSRGGQGIVYQAVERATKRKVAIKVLLEGADASPAARKRFEREIELVARLKHPHVLSVLHSGVTADGRQYCVMDYVRGTPLRQYVRERKLGLEAALTLFATVVEAVQYAHQHGIIHRDLKPSNIFVDAEDQPRILDFGLAKSLWAPTTSLVSRTHQVLGTLPYLSPEQARGDPDALDTRTDVYALGVILYELLTGDFPYPVVGQMADVLRHIAETPPAPPAARWTAESGVPFRAAGDRRRGLFGAGRKAGRCPIDDDVQTILLRALAKERERRYQSAGELARDIRHYLAGEAIAARRDSRFYVFRKTLHRYRAAVGVVALLIVTLTAALAVSVSARNRAEQERDRARAAEQRKRMVVDFLNEVLRSANPFAAEHGSDDEAPERAKLLYAGQGGEVATVVDVLRAAARRLDGLAVDPRVEADLRHALGATLTDVGEFHHGIVELRKAVELRRALTGGESAETIESLERLTHAVFLEGDMTATLALARPVYDALLSRQGALDAGTRAFGRHVGRALEALKRPDEAIQILRHLSDAAAALAGPDDDRVIGLRLELARLLSNHDQPVEALRINMECMSVLTTRPDARRLYARAAEGVADALFDAGRYREAVAASRTAVQSCEAVYGRDHPLTAYQRVYLCWALGQTDQLEEARKTGEQALDAHRRFSGAEHEWTYRAERALARVLAGLRKEPERAEAMARHAFAGYERIYGADHVQTLYARDVLGVVLHHAGRHEAAESLLRENVALGARSLKGWEYARHLRSLGLCLAERGRRDEAEQHLLHAWTRTTAAVGAESDAAHQVAGDLAGLYEAWDAAEPGQGHGAKVAEWRSRATSRIATAQSVEEG